jgi:hypothetical protein
MKLVAKKISCVLFLESSKFFLHSGLPDGMNKSAAICLRIEERDSM